MDHQLTPDRMDIVKPRVRRLLRALAMDVVYHRGQGNALFYRAPDDREVEVLDLVGGYGALLFGHNYPPLVAEAQQILASSLPHFVQGSFRKSAELLARELSLRAGGEFHVVFGNSGTEAVEAAIKHAMLETGGRTFICLTQAFHGKTIGSLQFIGNEDYRDGFRLPGLNALRVPAGDLAALEEAFAQAEDLAGFIFEPIQGEGGVRPVDPQFAQLAAKLCRLHGVPLIADECQTGLGRTGAFLACEALGVRPDYIILSKALGGGLAKISALLIQQQRYVDAFDWKHTSTYAEDDYSSRIALKVMELLDQETITCCRNRGELLLSRLRQIQADHPGVIADVRGAGLLVGVQFHREQHSSVLLRMLAEQADLGYLLSAFLFHEHRIRIAPTLSSPFTLRIEPSVLLSDQEIERLVTGLREVCDLLQAQDAASLTRFVINAGDSKPGDRLQPIRAVPTMFRHERVRLSHPTICPTARVAWLCHLVDADGLSKLEPAFAREPYATREAYLRRLAPFANPIVMSETDIRSTSGRVLRFYPIMLPVSSRTMMDWMEQRQRGMLHGLIDKGIEVARSLGCSVLSLGQYTSIATAGGQSLAAADFCLTNGNSYTVSLVVRALRNAERTLGRQPRRSVLAVVGAAGNIGGACAELLAADYARTILIGSNRRGSLARLNKLAARIPSSEVATDLASLLRADAAIIAVNSVDPLFSRDDFAQGAIVCDVSCPAAVAAAPATLRADLHLFSGGIAQLPYGEDLGIFGFPLPVGQVYGCMAEAMVLGFEKSPGMSFTGSLSLKQIDYVDSRAERHGFQLTQADPPTAASKLRTQLHVHAG